MSIHYNIVIYPTDLPKSNILMLHGYGEHIGRYDKLGKRLNQSNCAVYGFDFRGHGKSDGKPGVIDSFEDYLDDIDYIYSKIPTENLKVYAHSMGALALAYWMITRPNHQISEVVYSSGLFKLDDSVAPMLRKAAKYLSAIAPWVKAPKIDSSSITRVPQEVQKYDTDPLINRKGTRARTGYEFMKAMKFVLANADKIDTKAMVITGDADRLTNMAGSEEMYENLSSKSKSMHIIQGGYHELLNDECEKEYIDLVVSFLAS